ncbi:hypothetical protein PR048_017100 [Dryococelus australis]|uniref:Uncharacterized protein n=1 Tax=Dryococelus australis TaxID=614101 RepID=A0ABQ9H8S7_9NEOP|nr:hypothetical protein PR048_017100 [Dryococelus australis]
MRLTRFRFKILHVHGKENSVTDASSRMYDPLEFVVPSDIAEEQETGELCNILHVTPEPFVDIRKTLGDYILHWGIGKETGVATKVIRPMILCYFQQTLVGGGGIWADGKGNGLFCNTLLEVWKETYQTLLKTYEKMSDRYNKNRIPYQIKVGDFFILDYVSAKLALLYDGPYKVQSFLTPVTVTLVDPSNN